ncbi:MAG: hypothetical protein Kow00127_06450 [Bacteroidales bacterium]
MKKAIITGLFSILLLGGISALKGQEAKPYNPDANAREQIAGAVSRAAENGKHVFLMIGGNWCPWCLRFHRFVNENSELLKLMHDNYEWEMINYSKENKNLDILAELGYPQRFGFPVFVILDGKGNRLHTQNSAYLEKDKSYDAEKVKGFLMHWSPAALDPTSYR